MNEDQCLSRINQLESEIEYLHGLFDLVGIPYKRKADNVWGGSKLKDIYGYRVEGNDIGECWG